MPTNSEDSAMIETAIANAIANNTDFEDGDLLIDWVVVAYVQNPDSEKRPGYPLFVSNGSMPKYRIKGLLHHALDLLNRVQRRS